jgi:23S rRNA (cytidine1920-2'-O)/16S rRNA (cytidine1409-2'-O)-methyltransferase
VIAVDTGRGQIAAKLRSDPRITLLENTNARFLDADAVQARVDFIAMDVSFISATLVLPAVIRSGFKGGTGELVTLVKPQFEAGREHIGKGGIVRDAAAQQASVEKVRTAVVELGGSEIEVIDSPITGAEGNREFLLHAKFSSSRS